MPLRFQSKRLLKPEPAPVAVTPVVANPVARFCSKRLAPKGDALSQAYEGNPGCAKCVLRERHVTGKNKTLCVHGDIPTPCDILVIGEAPGQLEDAQGKPFVGPTGTYLRDLLGSVLEGEAVGYDNVVHCRPEGNDWPGEVVRRKCEGIITKVIEAVKPKLIVAVGGHALGYAIGDRTIKITTAAGVLHWRGAIPVCPIYHPSYVMRNGDMLTERYVDQTLWVGKMWENVKKYGLTSNVGRVKVRMVTSKQDLSDLVSAVYAAKLFAWDTETDSLRAYATDERVLLMSIATDDTMGWIVPLSHPEAPKGFKTTAIPVLRQLLTDSSLQSIAHNAKFDMLQVKANLNIDVANLHADTMLMAYMLNESRGVHGLKHLAKKYTDLGGYEMPLERLSASDNQYNPSKGGTYANVPLDTLAKYAACDAVVTRMIYDSLLTELHDASTEEAPLENIATKMLTAMACMLTRVESAGMSIDRERVEALASALPAEIESIEADLLGYDAIQKYIRRMRKEDKKFEFNPDSTRQTSDILFKVLKLEPIKLTATEAPCVDEEVLKTLAPDHEWVAKILKHREKTKLLGTYVQPLLGGYRKNKRHEKPIVDRDGCVRTMYSMHQTVTGRLSSSRPNLQNVPKGEIKAIYCSRYGKDGRLVQVDLSQIELRVVAMLSGDPNLVRCYLAHEDLHWKTASMVYNIPIPELVAMKEKGDATIDKIRRVSKSLNFGVCLSGNSLTRTKRGTIRAENVRVGDMIESGFGMERVTKVWDRGEKPTLIITVEGGYAIECTKEHPLYQYGNNWAEAGDLRVGDYVGLSARKLAGSGTISLFKHVPESPRTSSVKGVTLPLSWSDKLGFVLGMCVSEGHMRITGVRRQLMVTMRDCAALRHFHACLQRLFNYGKLYDIAGGKYKCAAISCRKIWDFLHSLGLNPVTSGGQSVPESLWAAPLYAKRAFIEGFFAGDGSIRGNYIRACSKSVRLMSDLQQLLLEFGIASTVTPETRSGYGMYYVLCVRDFDKFSTTFTVLDKPTPRLRRKVCHELIPVPSSDLKRWSAESTGIVRDKLTECLRNTSPIQFNQARAKFVLSQHTVPELSECFTHNIRFRKVVSVRESSAHVFDFCVANRHSFVANGFITHNCYGIGPQGIVSTLRKEGITLAVDEAAEYIRRFYSAYPAVRSWIDDRHSEAMRDGHVRSPFGRLRRLPEANSSEMSKQSEAMRQASNAPIQSAASDLTQLSLVKIDQWLQKDPVGIVVGTVHDSILFDTPHEDNALYVARRAKEIMETIRVVNERNPLELLGWGPQDWPWLPWSWVTIPIEADVEIGTTWDNVKKVKLEKTP